MLRTLIALFAAAGVVAGGAGPNETRPRAHDAGGVLFDRRHSAGLADQRSETLVVRATIPVHNGVGRLVEELSIGAVNGPEATQFGEIAGAAVGADGSIFIADPLMKSVRQFDKSGRFVRSFGRPGTGPGEYQSPTYVTVMRDGTVIVYSRVGGRVLAYFADGRPRWTKESTRLFGFNRTLARPYAPLAQATTDQLVYVRHYPTASPGFVRTPMRRENPSTFARWNPDGTPVDTLTEPVFPLEPPFIFVGPRADPPRSRQVPFTPAFTWTLSPLGYFVSGFPVDRGGQYSIDLRLPVRRPGGPPKWVLGDPVQSIHIPYTKIPVAAAERADYQTTYARYMRDRDPRWSWNAAPIPANKPPYKMIWADDTGRIWVMLHTPAITISEARPAHAGGETNVFYPLERWREPQVFDVVEPTGRYLGKVASRETIYPAAARGDTLWATVQSDLGLLTLKRYRIIW